jgi:hypothetical protein
MDTGSAGLADFKAELKAMTGGAYLQAILCRKGGWLEPVPRPGRDRVESPGHLGPAGTVAPMRCNTMPAPTQLS